MKDIGVTADMESFFFLSCVQMSETPSYLYWFGGGIGAVSLASISAAVMWIAEKKVPTIKTLSRDLILGCILFFLLLQLLPESTMTLVTTIVSFFKMNEGVLDTATAATVAAIATSDEMEVRVGVPSF